DRALMNHLATKVLDLSSEDKEVFEGSFDEYRRKKQKDQQREQSRSKAQPAKAKATVAAEAVKFQAKADKAKRTPWKLEALEKKSFTLEERLEELAAALADPALYSNPAEQKKVSESYEKTKRECEDLTSLWEEMA